MQSVITSSFVGVFFPHSMELDNTSENMYFLLFEPYTANYSVKVIASMKLVKDMIQGYDNEWTIASRSERKSPLILLATGVMSQQPAARAFLGRIVEEKFHMQALDLTIIPAIPLVPERLKEMVHPELAPINLGDGVKEGYFYVNLSTSQDFTNGPEFYDNAANDDELGEYEREILEGAQRRNQKARGDDIQTHNPYYTDEDEPYAPPDNFFYTRRMSDSSAEEHTENQSRENMAEEFLRNMQENANRTRGYKNYNFANTSGGDIENSELEETIMQSRTNLPSNPASHAGTTQDAVRTSNTIQQSNTPQSHDPMEGSSRSAMADFAYTRNNSFASDFYAAGSDFPSDNDFRNLSNPIVEG
ncbi:uncharacterized protein EV154DRAFT_540879 [Mucor mucedo]|uniref:uncharacterized protein n=1 Tax=Mucor mucedo TaxID=29922 RepID=UPI00221EC709|nr:uncharacterized protein EV154DRAFT_540879 [Mucor mucedo]KAI7868386.1 hypothetical protein EV154DRAFT_540879 [Mucor mucedo]